MGQLQTPGLGSSRAVSKPRWASLPFPSTRSHASLLGSQPRWTEAKLFTSSVQHPKVIAHTVSQSLEFCSLDTQREGVRNRVIDEPVFSLLPLPLSLELLGGGAEGILILGNRKGFKANALELENTEAELSVLFLMVGVLVEEERAGEAQRRGRGDTNQVGRRGKRPGRLLAS